MAVFVMKSRHKPKLSHQTIKKYWNGRGYCINNEIGRLCEFLHILNILIDYSNYKIHWNIRDSYDLHAEMMYLRDSRIDYTKEDYQLIINVTNNWYENTHDYIDEMREYVEKTYKK